jgi:hypothetical protein
MLIDSSKTMAENAETCLRQRAGGLRALVHRVLVYNHNIRERAPYTVKRQILEMLIYGSFSFPIPALIFPQSSAGFGALESALYEAVRCIFNMPRSFPKHLVEAATGILPLWPTVLTMRARLATSVALSPFGSNPAVAVTRFQAHALWSGRPPSFFLPTAYSKLAGALAVCRWGTGASHPFINTQPPPGGAGARAAAPAQMIPPAAAGEVGAAAPPHAASPSAAPDAAATLVDAHAVTSAAAAAAAAAAVSAA